MAASARPSCFFRGQRCAWRGRRPEARARAPSLSAGQPVAFFHAEGVTVSSGMKCAAARPMRMPTVLPKEKRTHGAFTRPRADLLKPHGRRFLRPAVEDVRELHGVDTLAPAKLEGRNVEDLERPVFAQKGEGAGQAGVDAENGDAGAHSSHAFLVAQVSRSAPSLCRPRPVFLRHQPQPARDDRPARTMHRTKAFQAELAGGDF